MNIVFMEINMFRLVVRKLTVCTFARVWANAAFIERVLCLNRVWLIQKKPTPTRQACATMILSNKLDQSRMSEDLQELSFFPRNAD